MIDGDRARGMEEERTKGKRAGERLCPGRSSKLPGVALHNSRPGPGAAGGGGGQGSTAAPPPPPPPPVIHRHPALLPPPQLPPPQLPLALQPWALRLALAFSLQFFRYLQCFTVSSLLLLYCLLTEAYHCVVFPRSLFTAWRSLSTPRLCLYSHFFTVACSLRFYCFP